jgi:hypothetical protein
MADRTVVGAAPFVGSKLKNNVQHLNRGASRRDPDAFAALFADDYNHQLIRAFAFNLDASRGPGGASFSEVRRHAARVNWRD